MTTFTDYRDGPGGKIAQTILGKSIAHLSSWAAFSEFTYGISCVGQEGRKMIERSEAAYASGHIGERAVILATLFAMDRSAQAIKMETREGEHLLSIMNYVDDPHRQAVAACLMLEN